MTGWVKRNKKRCKSQILRRRTSPRVNRVRTYGETRFSPEGRQEPNLFEEVGRRRLIHYERQLQMLHDPVHNGILRDEGCISLQAEHGIGLTSPLQLPPIVE